MCVCVLQEALSATLHEKEQDMERWRMERDTLVAALEVQLQKLLSSNAEKDKLIASLSCSTSSQPPEVSVVEIISGRVLRETQTLFLFLK